MRRERDGALRRCASFVQSSRDHGTPERKRAALSVPSPLGKTGTETHGVSNEFPCGKHHAQRWMRALWQLARHCAMPCFHQSLIRRLRRHLPHRGRLRCGGRPMVAPAVCARFSAFSAGGMAPLTTQKTALPCRAVFFFTISCGWGAGRGRRCTASVPCSS